MRLEKSKETAVNKTQIRYAIQYWRLAIHLVFKTKHFGVNNRWWSKQP